MQQCAPPFVSCKQQWRHSLHLLRGVGSHAAALLGVLMLVQAGEQQGGDAGPQLTQQGSVLMRLGMHLHRQGSNS